MAENQRETTDSFQWLEEIQGAEVLRWVAQRNEKTVAGLASSSSFESYTKRLKAIMDSDDRIPYINKIGESYYNFWQDGTNPKGVLRRTSLEEYRKSDPEWEIVLDVDQLSNAEGENWVYRGSTALRDHDRTLISLSRGGSDAVVIREFDLTKKQFVKDGFELPEAKGGMDWLALDEVLVATDFGADTLTDSGYPRVVKLWKRGQPLTEAKVIFEGKPEDVSVSGFSDLTKGFETNGVVRSIDFYHSEMYLREADDLSRLDKPLDGTLVNHRNWIFVQTKTSWTIGEHTYPGNSLLFIDRSKYRAGDRNFEVLFEPRDGSFLADFALVRDHVFVIATRNVQDETYRYSRIDGVWQGTRLEDAEAFQSVSLSAVDRRENNQYFRIKWDFLTPATLEICDVGNAAERLKQSVRTFDSEPFQVSQHWVTSADETEVPYFLIRRKDAKQPGPTLLYGYGGFEIAMLPQYLMLQGPAWLERGGTYVVANIRGGGEFGPEWHLAALRENRPRAYEDFIAVAEDLIDREITTANQLGAMGGSNGGLLMGNMLTKRPDLFGALAIAVPLIDMSRYHKLLAGASWVAEYGDPDNPDDWEFMRGFSPYHNLKQGIDYPAILVTTSTRDDRVHPGHARKLVAKLEDLGHEVWYYENTEGGHAGAADNSQRAFMTALEYEFLWQELTN